MPRTRLYYHPETRTFHEWPADSAPEPTRLLVVGDTHHDGQRAADGTLIDTKKRRRDWMRANDKADMDDFTGTWAQAERIRKEGDPADRKSRREVIGRIAYEMEMGRGRKR